jgi:hypothetical protein
LYGIVLDVIAKKETNFASRLVKKELKRKTLSYVIIRLNAIVGLVTVFTLL